MTGSSGFPSPLTPPRMPKTSQLLGVKTLPSAVALHASSPSESHPVVAVASPSTSSESKVSLYRTSGGSDLVWEWTNVGVPPKPTGGLGLKGKAKAAPVGKIEQLAWSPRGERSPSTYTRSQELTRNGTERDRELLGRCDLASDFFDFLNSRNPLASRR
jgi:hypothetical protein